MLRILTCLMLALALATLVPAATADDLAGVSGECYSEGYEDGGKAHVAVSDEGEVSHSGLVNEDDPADLEGGAVSAVATFAQGLPAFLSGGTDAACTGPEEGGRKDYLEAHVLGAQVCYDTELHTATEPDAWECGTRPVGP